MTYPETIQYLESFINYEKIPYFPYKESLKLERIKEFLAKTGNPQDALQCIHIAGTKGKGSTCAFITYILREAGYKVGLYTSPHLSDFRERIRILTKHQTSFDKLRTLRRRTLSQVEAPNTKHQDVFEGLISKDGLTELVVKLKPAIDKYNKNSKYGPLSFFEVYTSLAFAYFKEKKVDFVVLETGLGGRLDATNVINPLVCAITSISYEHTQKLGNTLEEIAKEKAGIIKIQNPKSKIQNLIVISAPQEKKVMRVISKQCKSAGARLYEVGKDITYHKNKYAFNIKGIFGEYTGLKTRLIGGHQLINATTAIGVIDALRNYDIKVGVGNIRGGLYNTVWPGRCEVIYRNPLVILDGAQNVASARVLKEAIKKSFSYKKLILVLGISKDKDIKGVCRELCLFADEIILTQADNPRAASVDDIEKNIDSPVASRQSPVRKTKNVSEAITLAKGIAKKEDLILVTGSLFVAGEARSMF